SEMGTNPTIAGIAQNGTSGNFTYSVIGPPNHPITYVSWYDAARFANWLSNGQPVGAEGPGTTETGSYTLKKQSDEISWAQIARNASAVWVIPSEDEWYKSAYYNSQSGTYYKYPFANNSLPISAKPGSTPNSGNLVGNTGYAVTGSANFVSGQN